MKIGIEAKWLFHGPPSGRRVVRNLLRGLAEAVGDDEIHLILDDRARGKELPIDIPSDRCHYVWARNNQLANLFVVPRVADRVGLDAVVYQNFVPPPAAVRHVRVAFVNDVIFESHPEFFTRSERLYFKSLRFLTSTADRVCTLSGSEAARLVRFNYATADRVDVVPMAVDDTFAPREHMSRLATEAMLERLDVPESFVLYAGRLNVRKNVATLIRAMSHVTDRELALVVVGANDATSAYLESIAFGAGVGDRVHFLGALDDDALAILYATASLFCFPSFDEGFGLPPLEAMASGTPTIVSNAPAMVETCGDAAVYVDPNDAADIARAINALVADPERCTALRYAGIERARSYTWNDAANRLLGSVHAAVRGAHRLAV
jgi:glycosyltransferase involved in cell wall biosynthesis